MTKNLDMARACEVAEKIASEGCSVAQIASAIGVSPETIYNWMKKKPQFNTAVTRGRNSMIHECTNRLLRKAKGYTILEKTYSKNGATGEMEVVKEVEKYIAPDTGALVFILCNKDPEHWKNVQHAAEQSTKSPQEIAEAINADTKKAVDATLGKEEK